MQPYKILVRFIRPFMLSCLLAATLAAGATAGITPDLATRLQTMAPEERIPIIVRFAADSSATAVFQSGRRGRTAAVQALRATARTRRQKMAPILGDRGAARTRSLWLIDALAVSATPETIRRLAATDGVADIRIDRRHHKKDLLMALTDAPASNITHVGAPPLWALDHFGQGVTVGLMDSGADRQHPDLAATWRGGTNSWFDPYGRYAAPVDTDSDGHGTAVLGIMVGGEAGGTTIGAAPKAWWIAARMFDDNDMVTDSVIHQIFQWFLDPDGNTATDDAPDVINGSWGLLDADSRAGACITDFQADIAALNSAGIATVFAAGNYGPDAATSISPANYADTIAVGAVDDSDLITAFSSRGPTPGGACGDRIYPDVVAPGVMIKTTTHSQGGNANYVLISGTSFSAPHASGALALLAGAFPGAGLGDLKTALTASAVDLGDTGPDNVYGNGRIALDDTTGAFAYLRDTLSKTPCVRPEISFSANPAPGPGTLGQTVTFTATVSGSGGPYTYSWDVNGDGTADGAVNAFQHTYNSTYTGSVSLTVIDDGAAGCPATLVKADQWACPAMTATISAQPDPVTAGRQVTLSGAVSGGASPYTYAWDLDGDGGADCTSNPCTHIYNTAGDQSIDLTVTDTGGCTASAQKTLTVAPMPDYCLAMTVTITAQPDPAIAGSQVTLTGSASGGTPPYTYSWDLDGDGSADCTSATCTPTYSAAGNQAIALTALDADVCSASSQKNLTVESAPSPSPQSGGSSGGCFVDAALGN